MCTYFTNKNEVAIEFSRKQKHVRSTSGTFIRLIVLDYKSTRKEVVRRRVVVTQSALSKDALRMKRTVVV